ncbi:5892_t:CDS:1 [Funneliformis mosseae]|uniref:5892_t:CDS:1 n=1 Tax=Funneliformis mosseae TaxID=27381 RepID=A0A9N9GLX0_FUNMO|nr:5892_t:CDS:1 [Funneliformis mosseae]
MTCQLPIDCLHEIFEYLEGKVTLHSCLLVNRLWCEVSVQILWRSIRNYHTLIACLPNESREILIKNEIMILTTTSNPPLFNYISFVKELRINEIGKNIYKILRNSHPNTYNDKYTVVIQEIFKTLMNQISLKKMNLFYGWGYIRDTPFITYPGAMECLKNLSEFNCDSNIHSEFFYQLSQICNDLQSLKIRINSSTSDGLTDLITAQQNLKHLTIIKSYYCKGISNMIPSITSHSNGLIKLNLCGNGHPIPFSFISKFTNLQELILTFNYWGFKDFEKLQDVTLSHLRVLKFKYGLPKHEYLRNFLENNGTNLEKFYHRLYDQSLSLAIASLCSNVKSLRTVFFHNDLETLKEILNGCRRLESMKVRYDNSCLSEKELLEAIAIYSPRNFFELKIDYDHGFHSELKSVDLESFFKRWTNRVPQKPISLILINKYHANSLADKKENMSIIETYTKLGVIKKFEVKKLEFHNSINYKKINL